VARAAARRRRLSEENRRFYPNKDLASHVLGYVGIDNDG
jgi:stage V sporulation protein D (sporulation-specific penicillin-binding protein)